MTWIDGSIVGLYLLIVMTAGIMVRRYVGKVEDYLVAGREVNLYLGMASLAATEFGIVTCMYTAQNGYQFGFSGATPGILQAIMMVLVGVTGFCIKPLRDAGVVTIPELFEQRFGGRIRWAAGVVIVLGGLLNMGMFLRVGGEFLIIVAAVDEGAHSLEFMMTLLLIAVAIYTILGGMLSVLVTDYLQFVIMSVGLLTVTFLLLFRIGWSSLVEAVELTHGAGGFNPLQNDEMGWSFVIYFAILQLAAVLTWQTVVQRLLAARDTKTGRRMYTYTGFFFACRFIIPGLWGIVALVMLTPEQVGAETLHAMPKLLAMMLPVGVMGLLVAAMLAADMSTNSSYMLSWASVIYNDILAPFRRNAWSERRGILWNRSIVGCIGVFLLFFGLWVELPGNVWAYLAMTGTIYMSSMLTLLVACCYWRPANSWGGAASIVVGAVIPLTFLTIEQLETRGVSDTAISATIGPYWSGIAAFAGAALAMVIGSLLKNAIHGQKGARA